MAGGGFSALSPQLQGAATAYPT
ncbi:hypothetical protein CCACVL1_14461, partial [Corchorus capsularis]